MVKMALEDIGKTRRILQHHGLRRLTPRPSSLRPRFATMTLSSHNSDYYRQHYDVRHLYRLFKLCPRAD